MVKIPALRSLSGAMFTTSLEIRSNYLPGHTQPCDEWTQWPTSRRPGQQPRALLEPGPIAPSCYGVNGDLGVVDTLTTNPRLAITTTPSTNDERTNATRSVRCFGPGSPRRQVFRDPRTLTGDKVPLSASRCACAHEAIAPTSQERRARWLYAKWGVRFYTGSGPRTLR